MIICCLITLNDILTCGKYQLCTHNQSLDMDILNFNEYCMWCFIAPIHVKKNFKKVFKNCCTPLTICRLITLNKILTCRKIQLCTHNRSSDMDI